MEFLSRHFSFVDECNVMKFHTYILKYSGSNDIEWSKLTFENGWVLLISTAVSGSPPGLLSSWDWCVGMRDNGRDEPKWKHTVTVSPELFSFLSVVLQVHEHVGTKQFIHKEIPARDVKYVPSLELTAYQDRKNKINILTFIFSSSWCIYVW